MDFINPAQHLQFLQHLVDLQRDIADNDADIAQFACQKKMKKWH